MKKFFHRNKNNKGSALIEFFFVAPIFVSIYTGFIILGDLYQVGKRAEKTAEFASELISANNVISSDEKIAYLNVTMMLMSPYNAVNDIEKTVNSVMLVRNNDDVIAKWCWGTDTTTSSGADCFNNADLKITNDVIAAVKSVGGGVYSTVKVKYKPLGSPAPIEFFSKSFKPMRGSDFSKLCDYSGNCLQ